MHEYKISEVPKRDINAALFRVLLSRKHAQPEINKTYINYLLGLKSQIDGVISKWDKHKRFTNPYEFIHTQHPYLRTPICTLTPLSRSYYKLIEIIAHYNLLDEFSQSITCFSFAEGPGGFIQALLERRNNKFDIYYGMTLTSTSQNAIPGWRKAKEFMSRNGNVKIYQGITGNGDLLHAANLIHCYKTFGGKCSFATADGGFDFTSDFSNQEAIALPLAFAQIAYAMAVQAKNGTFILKLFDTTTAASVDLLYLLWCAYDRVDIYKPDTSRPANSERYIICRGFTNLSTLPTIRCMACILSKLQHGWKPTRFINCNIPYKFRTSIQEANAIFGQSQVDAISTTLSLIQFPSSEKIESLVHANSGRCIKWCKKHGLPATPCLSLKNRRIHNVQNI